MADSLSSTPTKSGLKHQLHSGITQYSAAYFLGALVLMIMVAIILAFPLSESFQRMADAIEKRRN